MPGEWIPSDIDLGLHPKVHRLKKALHVTLPTVMGHLHLLWHFVARFATDGVLTDFTAEELAAAAHWDGDPQEFMSVMLQQRWIDRNADGSVTRVHDWGDHNLWLQESVERGREANRARQARFRERQKAAAGVTHDVPPERRNGDHNGEERDRALRNDPRARAAARRRPDLTGPNLTEPDLTGPDPARAAARPKPITGDGPCWKCAADLDAGATQGHKGPHAFGSPTPTEEVAEA